jgi:WD40 repeat protein
MKSRSFSKQKLKTLLNAAFLSGAVATCVLPLSNAYADFFVSSFGTNELMMFEEVDGEYLGVVANIQGPFASQVGFDGDLFVSSHLTGEVLRYDSSNGEYKGVYIESSSGLTSPTAPNFGPDDLVYVGDLNTNQVLRYDADGNFLDVFADGITSDLNGPFMQTFDDHTMLIASGHTNSILRYDLETKTFLGHFVKPNSGGLQIPVGLEFGPDGNLYTSSSATNEIYRYNGRTGEFIDVFVPAGSGGMNSPRAIRFGGPNSDLYVISSGTNEILQYDRITGEFIKAVATADESGMSASRGLTFTPRPEVLIYSSVSKRPDRRGYSKVKIQGRVKDYVDGNTKLKLKSFDLSDKSIPISRVVKGARMGKPDYKFKVNMNNYTGKDLELTVTYEAENKKGQKALAYSIIKIPSKG